MKKISDLVEKLKDKYPNENIKRQILIGAFIGKISGKWTNFKIKLKNMLTF